MILVLQIIVGLLFILAGVQHGDGYPGRWPGLVRMGRFTFDLDARHRLPDGFTMHCETGAPDGADGQ